MPVKTVTTQPANAPSKAARDFYEDAADVIANLASRWQDEKAYEDIEIYRTSLQTLATKYGVLVIKMTKRPFGCEFAVDGKTFKLSITAGGAYAYKRIA